MKVIIKKLGDREVDISKISDDRLGWLLRTMLEGVDATQSYGFYREVAFEVPHIEKTATDEAVEELLTEATPDEDTDSEKTVVEAAVAEAEEAPDVVTTFIDKVSEEVFDTVK